MTRLEEAQINLAWADAMTKSGSSPAGMNKRQVSAMRAEYKKIITREKAVDTTTTEAEQ